MRILYLGDTVGRAGRQAAAAFVQAWRDPLGVDAAVVNAENAAGGFGLTQKICQEMFAAGVDVITTGNHVWDQREVMGYIDSESRVLRPMNYPPGTPGAGSVTITLKNGRKLMVAQVMGRLFMDPLDDPFRALDQLLTGRPMKIAADAVLVDVHAEATSEKMAFGHFLDGRVSAVAGTHTHVPTADAQILPNGTAYQSDLGMCGDYDSVIGMQKDAATKRFTMKIPGERLAPADGEATVCGILVETDDATGLARSIVPVRHGGRLAPAMPAAIGVGAA